MNSNNEESDFVRIYKDAILNNKRLPPELAYNYNRQINRELFITGLAIILIPILSIFVYFIR